MTYFGPYLEFKTDFKATKTYSRTTCNNKDCKNFNIPLHTDFCPHCGKPSFKKETVDFIAPDVYKLTNGTLTEIERFEGKFIVIPNCEVANLNSFNVDSDTQEFTYSLEKFSYEKEVDFFNKKFRKEIEEISQNFHSPGVVKFGILHYYR